MIFVMLSIIGLAACTAVAPQPAIDEVDVYTAVIRQIYTVDDTFGGTLQPPFVYIISQTDDTVGDPNIEQKPSLRVSSRPSRLNCQKTNRH